MVSFGIRFSLDLFMSTVYRHKLHCGVDDWVNDDRTTGCNIRKWSRLRDVINDVISDDVRPVIYAQLSLTAAAPHSGEIYLQLFKLDTLRPHFILLCSISYFDVKQLISLEVIVQFCDAVTWPLCITVLKLGDHKSNNILMVLSRRLNPKNNFTFVIIWL